MIFSSKNEDDTPAWQLILADKKTITRRLKPLTVGNIYSVNPTRYKKHVCKIRVLRCEPHLDAMKRLFLEKAQQQQFYAHESLTQLIRMHYDIILDLLKEEAQKEGFNSFLWLWTWFKEHDIDINQTCRIEFERVA